MTAYHQAMRHFVISGLMALAPAASACLQSALTEPLATSPAPQSLTPELQDAADLDADDDLTLRTTDLSRFMAQLKSSSERALALPGEQRFVIRSYECDARGPRKSGLLVTTGVTILAPERAPDAPR